MLWPQSQEYNEAIQNPKTCFKDPELKAGQAVTNALGMPVPCSGNFADVYQVQGTNGKGKWAVKCFTRGEPSSLRQRYAHIDKHLQQVKLPFTIGFQFLDEGMRIHGKWHPVLKMQWVEGFALNTFVKDNLDKPGVLEALLKIWTRMAGRLREADMAHADLQHGNVMFVPGSAAKALGVKLIDYDGMWVPSLAGQQSGEVGHPAYQHPQRLSDGTYSQDVDRFPLLVVATALRCLRVGGRSLWDTYDNGDNLLFRESDLKAPDESAVFKELSRLQDGQAKMLLERLRQACGEPLEKAPYLDEVMGDGAPKKASVSVSAPVPAAIAVEATLPQASSAFDGLGDSEPVVRPTRRAASPAPAWRKWALIGGAAAAVLLVVVIIAASSGGGGDKDDKPGLPKDQQVHVDRPKTDKPNDRLPIDPPQGKPPLTMERLPDIRLAAGESRQISVSVKGVDAAGFRAVLTGLPPRVEAKEISSDAAAGRAVWMLTAAADAGKSERTVGVVATSGDRKVDGDFQLTVDSPAVAVNPPPPGPVSGKPRQVAEFKADLIINGVRFSPDGSKIAYFWGNGIAMLDPTGAAIGKPIKRLVSGLCWLPDGRRFVVACFPEGVQTMDESGQGRPLAENPPRPMYLAVSADGHRAAAVCGDETRDPDGKIKLTYAIWIWDLEKNKKLHQIDDTSPSRLSMSADGSTLLAAGRPGDNSPLLIDVATGKERRKLSAARPMRPTCLALSPDGKLAALAYPFGKLVLWDVVDDREVHELVGHSAEIRDCVFSGDGRHLLSGAGGFANNPSGGAAIPVNCAARLWDVATGKQLRFVDNHKAPVTAVALSPDGRYAVTGDADKTGAIWDLNLDGGTTTVQNPPPAAKVNLVREFKAPDRPYGNVLFNPTEARALCYNGSVLHVIDLKTGSVLKEIRRGGELNGAAWLPDGRRFLLTSYTPGMEIVDADTGKSERLLANTVGSVSLAVSADGKRAANTSVTGGRKQMRIWDVEAGKELHSVPDIQALSRSMGISADGQRLLVMSAGENRRLVLFNAETGQEIRKLAVPRENSITCLSLSPDGRQAAIGFNDGKLKLWDVDTDSEVKKLDGHTVNIHQVAYSADGKKVISTAGSYQREPNEAYLDCTARVWDVATGQEMRRIDGHKRPVFGAALSPDGRSAITVSADQTGCHWDLGMGGSVTPPAVAGKPKELRTLEKADGLDDFVVFSPDGRKAHSYSRGGVVTWDLASGAISVKQPKDADNLKGVSADGKRIVTRGGGKNPTVIDLPADTQQELGSFAQETHFAAVCANGKLAITSSADRVVKDGVAQTQKDPQTQMGAYPAWEKAACKLWDLEKKKLLHEVKDLPQLANRLAIAANGSRAVLSLEVYADAVFVVWDLRTGKAETLSAGKGMMNWGVAVSDDGKLAALTTTDRSVRIWDLEAKKEIHKLGPVPDFISAVAISPDNKYVLSGGYEGNCRTRLWELSTGKEIAELEGTGGVKYLAFSPDGSKALALSVDGTGRLWSTGLPGATTAKPPAPTPSEAAELLRFDAPKGLSRVLSFSPDGRSLFGVASPKLVAWDIKTGNIGQQWTAREPLFRGELLPDQRHVICIGRSNKFLVVWNAQTGDTQTLGSHDPYINAMAVSRDGKRAVTISGQPVQRDNMTVWQHCNLKVWDVGARKEIREIPNLSGPVFNVAISGDGKQAIGGVSFSKTKEPLTVWDLDTGKATALPIDLPPRVDIGAIALSADGRLAALSAGHTIRLWDLEQGQEIRRLGPLPEYSRCFAFSADGRQLLSGGGLPQGTQPLTFLHCRAHLWDVATGRDLLQLEGDTEPVISVAFSPSGGRAVTLSENNVVRVWALKPGAEENPAADPPASAHAKARQDLAAAVDKAQNEYNTAITKLAADHKKRLQDLLQAETTAGHVDEALAVKEETNSPDIESPALFTEKGRLPVAKPRWMSGTWMVKYHPNKSTYTFVIKPSGEMVKSDGGSRGRLKPEGISFLQEPFTERPERYTFLGNRLFMEHYFSKEDFDKNLVNQVGVAEWIKPAPTAPKPPPSLTTANKEHAEAVGKAKAGYNAAATKATADYRKQLQDLLQEATKAGKLDDAVAIREQLKTVDAYSPPLFAKWIPGTWEIRYHPNKTVLPIVILPNGEVSYPDGKKKGQIRTLANLAVLEAGGRVERFTFEGERLFIEHYLSQADYARNAIDQVGIGTLIKK